MKKEDLEKTIKAVKIRAVAQFATARNNEAHDKQWALSKAPSSLINCGADVDHYENRRRALKIGLGNSGARSIMAAVHIS